MSDWGYPGCSGRIERSIRAVLVEARKDYRANGDTEVEPDRCYRQRVNYL